MNAAQKLEDAVDNFNRNDKSYHRSLAKPLTLKVLTKKQRKQLNGPTVSTMLSINAKDSQQFVYSDGSMYMGIPAQFLDMRKDGLGYQKVADGLPFVKVQAAA